MLRESVIFSENRLPCFGIMLYLATGQIVTLPFHHRRSRAMCIRHALKWGGLRVRSEKSHLRRKAMNCCATRRGIAGGFAAAGFAATFLAVSFVAAPTPASAQSGEPITIGLAMSVTGPLAPNGKRPFPGRKSGKRKPTPRAVCSVAKSSSLPTTISPTRPTFPASTPSSSTSIRSTSSSAVTRPTWSRRPCRW